MRIDTRKLRVSAALGMAILCAALSAQQIGMEAEAGNIQFPWTQNEPTTAAAFPSSNYFWGGEAWFSAPLGEDASVKIDYERDPVLRNTATATVQFERGIAKIAVGPLIGFLNSDASPFSAGISAALRLQWPGVAYLSMRSDGGTAISLLQSGSDPQARTEFAAGFYVPHAIVSGVVSASRFNDVDAAGYRVTDSLTRYAMTFDVFKKNVPYTALFSIGYEARSKYFEASATTDSLGAVVLGLEASAQINDALKLTGGISSGAYVFGLDALAGKGPGSSAFMFDAKLGMSLDISALRAPAPRGESDEAQAEAAPAKPAEAAAEGPAEGEPVSKEPEAKSDEATPSTAAQSTAAQSDAEAAKGGEPKRGFSISAGAGLQYDAYPLSGTAFDVLLALFNLRGGLWADLLFPLKDGLSLGPEIGLYYMTATIGSAAASLVDLPLNAKVGYSLGGLRIEGFGGLLASAAIASSASYSFGLDTGARLRLGNFYAEGSYVFGLGGAQSFPRFGLGYAIDLKK